MRHPRDAKSNAAIGQRLVLTRSALGMNQGEFGARAGIKANTLSQLENGQYRPSLDTAVALCEVYSLTLDWIYFGDPSGLQYKLADAIKALRAAQQIVTPPRASKGLVHNET